MLGFRGLAEGLPEYSKLSDLCEPHLNNSVKGDRVIDLSTVPENWGEVIADKSKRQVGQIVPGERGDLVTLTAIVNAAGNSLPPVFMRVRYKEQFLQGAPNESLGIASKTGWITVELFPEVLKHIHKHSECTKDSPILLLMDNHNSHCSLSAIDFARMWGIVLLEFPPHCSHKLQPLDGGIFGPFKSALKVAFNDYLLTSRDTPLNSVALEHIKQYPKAELRKKRQIGLERVKSRIFTDTPEKTRIELINQANHDKRYRKKKTSKPAPPEELDETLEYETLIDLPDSDYCSIFSENDENCPNLLVDSDVINTEDFVLVKFEQPKGKPVFYIAKIERVFNIYDFDVTFLRKHNNYYVFPIIDDISQINRSDIVAKLPVPTQIAGTLRTKGYYNFNTNLNEYIIR